MMFQKVRLFPQVHPHREKAHETPQGDVSVLLYYIRAVLVNYSVYCKVIWAIYRSRKDVEMKSFVNEELNIYISL